MENDKKTIGTLEVLSAAGTRIKQARRAYWVVLVLGMILPELLLSMVTDVYGARTVLAIRSSLSGNFEPLESAALDFLGIMAPVVIILLLVSAVSYLALVQLAINPTTCSGGMAIRRGFTLAMPRGLALLFLIVFMLVVGQALVIPAIIVGILSIMAPVVLVAENKGAWRCLMDALTLRYARSAAYSGWSTFSCLLYIAGLFYLLALGIATMSERLLALDIFAGAPRSLYLSHFGDLPFGQAYLFVTILITITEQMVLSALPFVSTTLYLAVVGKRDLGQA